MSKPEEQLAATVQQLNQWRQTKQYKNSPIPEPLRQRIIGLLDHYPAFELKNLLNMSSSLLYRWAKDAGATTKAPATVQTTQFVTLSQVEPSADTALVVEVALGQQCQIRLSGDISTAQLDVFTRNIFMHQSEAMR